MLYNFFEQEIKSIKVTDLYEEEQNRKEGNEPKYLPTNLFETFTQLVKHYDHANVLWERHYQFEVTFVDHSCLVIISGDYRLQLNNHKEPWL